MAPGTVVNTTCGAREFRGDRETPGGMRQPEWLASVSQRRTSGHALCVVSQPRGLSFRCSRGRHSAGPSKSLTRYWVGRSSSCLRFCSMCQTVLSLVRVRAVRGVRTVGDVVHEVWLVRRDAPQFLTLFHILLTIWLPRGHLIATHTQPKTPVRYRFSPHRPCDCPQSDSA